jgi:cytochrome oxidase Cu insertion factor (SCO1/SenC/PrrC family)
MSIKTIFASAALFAAVLASCTGDKPGSSGGASGRAPAGAAVEEGSIAPEFSLTSANGTEVSLSGFRGSSVLLYFSMGPG